MNDPLIIAIAGVVIIVMSIIASVTYTESLYRRDTRWLSQQMTANALFQKQLIGEMRRETAEANRRQERWFKELGYRTEQIFERVDNPPEDTD